MLSVQMTFMTVVPLCTPLPTWNKMRQLVLFVMSALVTTGVKLRMLLTQSRASMIEVV